MNCSAQPILGAAEITLEGDDIMIRRSFRVTSVLVSILSTVIFTGTSFADDENPILCGITTTENGAVAINSDHDLAPLKLDAPAVETKVNELTVSASAKLFSDGSGIELGTDTPLPAVVKIKVSRKGKKGNEILIAESSGVLTANSHKAELTVGRAKKVEVNVSCKRSSKEDAPVQL